MPPAAHSAQNRPTPASLPASGAHTAPQGQRAHRVCARLLPYRLPELLFRFVVLPRPPAQRRQPLGARRCAHHAHQSVSARSAAQRASIHAHTIPCATERCSWQASWPCIIMSTYALRPGLVSVLLAPPGPPSSQAWHYAAAGSLSDTEPGPQAGHHLAVSLLGPAGDSEPAASSARRLPHLARVLRPPRPPAGAPGHGGVRAATRPRQATPGLQAHVKAPQGPPWASTRALQHMGIPLDTRGRARGARALAGRGAAGPTLRTTHCAAGATGILLQVSE
jgi:hypothetical protein